MILLFKSSKMEAYLTQLKKVVSDTIATDTKIGHEFDPSHEEWKSLLPLVSQKVLDASIHLSSDIRLNLEAILTISPEARPVKSYQRFYTKAFVKPPTFTPAFKAVCDFVAYRITCSLFEIPTVVDILKQWVFQNEGKWFERTPTVYQPDGSFADLIQYFYVYLPKVGIIEFQIGHPFAMYTFKTDSYLRENPTCTEAVDLWQNDFYAQTKQTILDKHNSSKIYKKLLNLFGDRCIPMELLKTLKHDM